MRLSDRWRKLLFQTACIPIRLTIGFLVVFVLPIVPYWVSIVAGVLFIIIAFFWLSFVLRCRVRETGLFGGPAYWAPARIVHAILFLTSGILCLLPGTQTTIYAGIFLLGDVCVGLSNFLVHYEVSICRPKMEV